MLTPPPPFVASTAQDDDASGPKVGYHVLMLQRASPGEEAGLEPYFDYIVRINGHRLVRVARSDGSGR